MNIVGTQNNAWSAAAVGINGDSARVFTEDCTRVSCFGNANAATTITAWVSHDGVTFFATSHNQVLAGAGDFHFTFETAARYVRLRSSAAATISATIAAKN